MAEITKETLFSSNTQAENEQLSILKRHFPNCFDKQGAFLPEKMAEALQSNGIKTEKESYSLNWLGKSYAKILKDRQPETLLAEDIEHNQKPENQNSENILIQGDNLEVLKHLKHAYKNQIKMIYIDPPYNTGSDGFVYQDDRKFTPQQLVDLGMDLEEAKRVLEFAAKKSNSHSAWLTFMYPRLYIARELLRDDGVIFISIDDNEQAQLKLLCDEVFGEENFVALLSVENNPKGRKNSKFISVCNDYCLIYALNYDKSYFVENVPKNINDLALDEFGNYVHNSGKRVLVGENDFNSLVSGFNSEKHYSVYFNTSTKDFIIKKEYKLDEIDLNLTSNGYTRYISYQGNNFAENTYTAEKINQLFLENALEFKENKIYEKNFSTTIRLKSILFNKKYKGVIQNKKMDVEFDFKTTSAGTMLKNIFKIKNDIFSAPKNINFIQTLMTLIDDKDLTILDFFAGSGTTAHSVMQLNAEDKGNRKFICVQLPEPTDEKSEAYKAGYKTIFDITKARIEKSAVKIRQDFKETTADLGFKIFKTEPHFQTALNTDFDPQIDFLPKNNLTDEQLHQLLTTWRVFDGCRLTEKVETVDLVGYTAYYCRQHLYLLASGFTSESVKALIEHLDNDKDFVPERIVLFGENIDSAMQKELAQAVKTYANKKGLNNLSVLARY
ncbi:site-specific DNA-methyltransferase [Haemophilus haemolyticus]|uniref:site-specific DNA-methyltransferase n=1 Tax=Haemophilus haemolyticus TaxID=726 RepID=UPI000E598B6A|nr:site-specific DNA-methyltransferase [Haemophilus haemolyticus]